jgi:hypothetical protein
MQLVNCAAVLQLRIAGACLLLLRELKRERAIHRLPLLLRRLLLLCQPQRKRAVCRLPFLLERVLFLDSTRLLRGA